MDEEAFRLVQDDDVEGLRRRLRRRIDEPDAANSNGWSLLHLAVYKGHAECARLLLSSAMCRCDVNLMCRKDSGWTPLHLAVNAQREECVAVLLRFRAKVNAKDKQDRTPLHLAAAGGSASIVRALLNADADTQVIDYKDRTPYHVAVQYDAPDIARTLLNVMREDGKPPGPMPKGIAQQGGAGGAPPSRNPRVDDASSRPPRGGGGGGGGNARAPGRGASDVASGGGAHPSRDPSPAQRPGAGGRGGGGRDGGGEGEQGEEEEPVLSVEEMGKEMEKELAKVIGLDEVKKMLRSLHKQIKVDQKRAKFGFEASPLLNMVFMGPPGTGKTSIARIVSQMFRKMGLLKKGHLVEVGRHDLVGEFAGSSAKNTVAKVDEAMGGVLLIDEAYALKHEGSKDSFGQEVLDTLVGELEKRKGKLVVIMSGYTKEMQGLLSANSGLDSRFPVRIHFAPYTYAELASIFRIFVQDRKLRVDPAVTDERLIAILQKAIPRAQAAKGNARAVANFANAALRRQTDRVAHSGTTTMESLLTINEDDLVGSAGADDAKLRISDVMAELDRTVGLDSVKRFIRSLRAQIQIRNEKEAHGLPSDDGDHTLHMIMQGNPGTGKTTIARRLGEMLAALGVLQRGHLVEVSRADLVGEHMGETAPKTKKVVERALGGLLFVDEAYGLVRDAKDSFGMEALDTLMKSMEDHRDEIVVVLAGYPMEMGKLMDQNPGLKSRFPVCLDFPDYSAEELMRIADGMLETKRLVLDDAAREKLAAMCESRATSGNPKGGNARFVRNVIEAAGRRQAERLMEKTSRGLADLTTFTAEDIPDEQHNQ